MKVETKMAKPKHSIKYFGYTLTFNREVDTIDEAQALIDYYRNMGGEAACLHENGKHQLYTTRKMS
jgi:hypothetical protein